jgi:1-acyl-sn-glycerol-3-phosphate acyltransferase
LLYVPLLPWRPAVELGVRVWAMGTLAMLRAICRLDHRVVGRENLSDRPVVIAAKHQSAWDTIVFLALLDRPAYVLKKELMQIPFYGWYTRRAGMISVDREAGGSALKQLMRQAEKTLGCGRSIVIFPQGTRVAPDADAPYQPGVVALYRHLNVPVVPVALNSGLFWRRRAFVRRPGTITLEFLPAIVPGLPKGEFAAVLRDRIEAASRRLIANP